MSTKKKTKGSKAVIPDLPAPTKIGIYLETIHFSNETETISENVSDVEADFEEEAEEEIDEKFEEIDYSLYPDYRLEVSYLNKILEPIDLTDETDKFKIITTNRKISVFRQYDVTVQSYHENEVMDFAGNCLQIILFKYELPDPEIPDLASNSARKTKKDKPTIKENLVGQVFLDLLPFAIEEQLNVTDRIKFNLNENYFEEDIDVFIQIKIQTPEKFLLEGYLLESNILSVTMESLANIPESWKTDQTLLNTAVVYPNGLGFIKPIYYTLTEPLRSFMNNKPRNVYKKFHYGIEQSGDNGITDICVNSSLKGIYHLNDLEEIEDTKIVFFDTIYRTIIKSETNLFLKDFIERDLYFVVELYVKIGNVEHHYMGFIDLAPLLYNGVYGGRFLVSLENYDAAKVLDLSQHAIKCFPKSGSGRPKTPKTPKSAKSKPPPSELKAGTEKAFLNKIEEGERPPLLSTPINYLLNEEGNRVYLIVEVELKNLYKEDFQEKDLNECFERHVTVKPKEVSNEAYIEFLKEIDDFIKYIKTDPAVTDIDSWKEELRISLKILIGKYFNAEHKTVFNFEFKNLMVDTFNELIYKINHRVSRLEYFDLKKEQVEREMVDDTELQEKRIWLAKEANEVQYYKWSENMYKKNISIYKNEEAQLDYIIYFLQNHLFEDSKSHALDLLERNIQSWLSLLLFTYHIYIEQKFDDYELFLIILTRKYPSNLENWLLLYCYYQDTKNRGGHQYALMKYYFYLDVNLKIYLHERNENFWEVEQDNEFLGSIEFFLKAGLYDFAKSLYEQKLCELENFEYSTYLKLLIEVYRKNESDVKAITDKFLFIDKNDNIADELKIRSLKGYYLCNSNNEVDGITELEYIYHCRLNPIDFRIFTLKNGFYKLKVKEYEEAKTYFVTSCMDKPSLFSWLGLGISCYRTNEIIEAEKCLSEANYMDQTFGDVWAYLGLVNLKFSKFDEAMYCLDEAVECFTEDQNIISELKEQLKDFQHVCSGNSHLIYKQKHNCN